MIMVQSSKANIYGCYKPGHGDLSLDVGCWAYDILSRIYERISGLLQLVIHGLVEYLTAFRLPLGQMHLD